MRFCVAMLLVLAASPSSAQLKVLCVGDSITAGGFGGGDASSYRKRLKDALTAAGISIDYVGPLASGEAGFTDNQHAGQSGWSTWTFGADPARLKTYVSDANPDYVLILIGTNDAYNVAHFPIGSALNELGRMIRMTLEVKATAHVIVATIPLITSAGQEEGAARAVTFNAGIPGLVAYERSRGGDVRYLKVAWQASDNIDGIHPNNTGYQRLADAFFSAIRAIEIPGPWPVNPTRSP